jgi:hypothetical protein
MTSGCDESRVRLSSDRKENGKEREVTVKVDDKGVKIHFGHNVDMLTVIVCSSCFFHMR